MRLVRVLLFVLVLVAMLPPVAGAAFPGRNGKILIHYAGDLWAMEPDGSARTNITNDPSDNEGAAEWSPDGSKIAFVDNGGIWVINADGSGLTDVTPDVSGDPFYTVVKPQDVAWSPDGLEIAFTNSDACGPNHGPGQVVTMNADGTQPRRVLCGRPPRPGNTKSPAASWISWSPSGEWIAFEAPNGVDCLEGVWRIHPDGTGLANVTSFDTTDGGPEFAPDGSRLAYDRHDICGPSLQMRIIGIDGQGDTAITGTSGYAPRWSPDGTRIAYTSGNDVWTVNPDGTSPVNLTNTPGVSDYADGWQPIPVNSYPRPKGATPFYGSLTIAYKPCTSPDRTHGPPLAYGSCSSPQMTSDYLTVGTADANGNPPRNEGYLRMGVVAGIPGGVDDADVTLEFFSDDVFTKALADYTGELRAKVALQITDKDNTPNPGGPGAATTTSIPLELTVGCTPVADTLEGSSCTATTSADALAPGTVKEGRRSIWQLGRVEVYDGGADGDAQTPAGDTLFQTQGLFVP